MTAPPAPAAAVEPPPRRALSLLLAAAAGWAALAAAIAGWLGDGALDDFFITYRYADNLARGRGFVFNPGERVFGTTAPGFGLLLAAAHRLSAVSISWLGALSTGAALVAIAWLLLREGIRRGRAAEAALGGTLAVGCTWAWGCRGAEAPVALALLLAAATAAGRRPILAGILAGAAVWVRPDAALGAGLLALVLVAERSGRPPWRYAAAVAATVGAGLLAAWLAFGTVVPNTWEAKRLEVAWAPSAQGTAWDWWQPGAALFPRHLGGGWALLLALGLAGQVLMLWRGGRAGRLLAAYGLALALVYPFLGTPFAGWYVIPPILAVLYGLAFLLGSLARLALAPALRGAALRGPALRAAAAAAAVGLAALTLPPYLATAWRWLAASGQPGIHFRGYRDAGLYLRARLPPEARIAALEVGTLAYFADRPVDDLLGLVSPASLPYVARQDLAGAFFARPPEALVLRPGLDGFLGGLLDRRRFRRRYREVLRLDPDTAYWTAIYRRRPNAPP